MSQTGLVYHDPESPLPVEVDQLWEVNAGWWQQRFTEGADPEYSEQIVPLLEEELGAVARRFDGLGHVLDIGCGEGQLSRVAAGVPGVREVVGLDPTWAQLAEAARRQALGRREVGADGGDPGRRGTAVYLQATAGALPFPDESFDAAFACLVFEHIEGAEAALGEVGRVLRAGGMFLLMLNHPLLQAPGSGWVDDHILGEQYWRIGPYLVEHHGVEEVDKGVWLPFIHRPLSVYVNSLAAAGLYLTGMAEPAPPPGFLDKAEEYQQAAAFPRLLVLRAEKQAR